MSFGGGKGGGSQQAPKIQIPQSLRDDVLYAQQTGNFASTLWNPLESMANWASDIATGGNVQGWSTFQKPYPGGQSGSSPGYYPQYTGTGTPSGVPGAGGQPGVQAAGPPQGQTSAQGAAPTTMITGNPLNWDWVAHDAGLSSSDVSAFIQQGLSPQDVASKYGLLSSATNLPGPWLTNIANNLNNEQQLAGQYPPGTSPGEIAGLQNQFFGNANQVAGNANPALAASSQALANANQLNAQGLFPNQQALIDAQTKSAQAAITQQLANEGLSGSTQAAELTGEIGQQGAAEAGQLIQGNIGLAQNWNTIAQGWNNVAQNWNSVAQNWSKLGMGEQTLGMAEQEQMFSMFSQIANQNAAVQSQMWSEAMQGFGMLANFIDANLKGYDLSIQGNADILQANIAQAQMQTNLDIASMQQQSSSSSSMFGALGSLFGSGGAIGGLFGGGAGAAGAAGGSSLVGGIVDTVVTLAVA